ncbi:flavin reductase family protein [Amycolatopsis sp. QT-25]|uniref:flavin reductase family protein n=1 Tax=Amycolatopsis sp. QT-25 TaxID=3034022 RepID=UPI0023EDA96E|nr:flavin reductase family protein [Amycolatopsis sp. QT-25]WET83229.1 flavin reductase family protein [Amycolatopsis sp. QT-25]
MSRFATGVTVLTTGGERVHGMTANAITSVSLEPPMLLCCVARTAVMHEAITSTGAFAVSVLGARQRVLAKYFSSTRRPLGATQFADIDFVPGPHTGAPLLTGALAWLECELDTAYDGGDHSIFVGGVRSAVRGAERDALLFFGGALGPAGPPAAKQVLS